MKLLLTEHALRAGALPGPHSDPFDRMLIAQRRFESLPMISADAVFAGYGLDVVWNS
jgi:PIN domain nuclease of toxin-antitoxin system